MTVHGKLSIAMVVHGRFHAFDLSRELLRRGHHIRVFTNYPAFIASRFGVPPSSVVSFPVHGVASRVLNLVAGGAAYRAAEPFLHPAFGRWARDRLMRERFDLVHCFTGVAEEILAERRIESMKTVVRGSAHIETQDELLRDEARRIGHAVERPTPWMVEREKREYALAGAIFVLSEFARASFLEKGVAASRLALLALGTELSAFRADKASIARRRERILAAGRLRVLFVGSFSARKGALDLAQAADELGERCSIRVVGPIADDAVAIAKRARGKIEFKGKVEHYRLPQEYAWGDVFVFPTIEDGFAVVLSQALAAGLPIIATDHCAAPELLREGTTGFLVPIRSPQAIVERIRWCDANRQRLAEMAQNVAATHESSDWAQVAARFEHIARGLLAAGRQA